MDHANGAKSVIAKAISGAAEPSDYWYEQAADLLEELRVEGYVVVEAPPTIGINMTPDQCRICRSPRDQHDEHTQGCPVQTNSDGSPMYGPTRFHG